MSNIQIVPTVMPESHDDFLEKIDRVYSFVKMIQIDVMDGKFVPSKSWPYNSPGDKHWKNMIEQDEGLPHWKKNDFEVDLMVADQIGEANNWIEVGVSRIIGHISAFQNDKEIQKFIDLGHDRGVEVYLALAPSVPNDELKKWLDQIDGVQFMGIEKVGYQGQEFSNVVLEKISDLHNEHPDLPISIDGGVSLDTVRFLAIAGATNLASGSAIFNSEHPKETIEELQKIAEGIVD